MPAHFDPDSKLMRRVDETHWLEVVPLTFGRARIILTDGMFVDDSW